MANNEVSLTDAIASLGSDLTTLVSQFQKSIEDGGNALQNAQWNFEEIKSAFNDYVDATVGTLTSEFKRLKNKFMIQQAIFKVDDSTGINLENIGSTLKNIFWQDNASETPSTRVEKMLGMLQDSINSTVPKLQQELNDFLDRVKKATV